MTETLEKPRYSGFCSPACITGAPHARDHASCQERLDDGRLTRCDCPDHTTQEGSPLSGSHPLDQA